MNIAYLLESTGLFGGVKVVLQQADALARRGHRVTVVSPEPAAEWFRLARARFERSSYAQSAALAEADVRVATFYRTVPVALDRASGPVFHLSQGYEGEIAYYKGAGLVEEIARVYRLPARSGPGANSVRSNVWPTSVTGPKPISSSLRASVSEMASLRAGSR